MRALAHKLIFSFHKTKKPRAQSLMRRAFVEQNRTDQLTELKAILRFCKPKKAIRALPNNQTAAGTGTAEMLAT
jgi:hypothetical protein